MNVVDPILFQSRHNPEAPAICAPGVDLVTYARLEKSIHNVARRAFNAGLSPGDSVAIFLPQHPVFHAVLILGLAQLGIATASVTTRKLPTTLRFDAMLSDGPNPHTHIKPITVDPSWITGDGTRIDLKSQTNDNALCRIVLTSGTTGEPKAVGLTHEMILGRVMRYHTLCGNKLPSCARMFCDLTLATSWGYTMLIYALSRGGAFFMRGNNAENTLRALTFYQVESLVAAPGALPELLTEYDRQHCQHIFEAVFIGGSTLSRRLAERVRARMGANVIAGYGSAETSLVASAPAYLLQDMSGAVGYVTPGMTVEVVDDSDRPLPVGENGTLRIRGDYMAHGYLGDSSSSQHAFRNGWFYPGDIGSLTEDQILIVSGRQTAVLNVGGEKIAPEAIEEVLGLFEGGIAAAATLITTEMGVEQIWVLIETASPIDENKLKEHCQKYLPSIFVPKRFVAVKSLPRNTMGKVERRELHQMLKPNLL
jgi:acyl-coenzyme A synthetase/AMP-(fatty) acid ligase